MVDIVWCSWFGALLGGLATLILCRIRALRRGVFLLDGFQQRSNAIATNKTYGSRDFKEFLLSKHCGLMAPVMDNFVRHVVAQSDCHGYFHALIGFRHNVHFASVRARRQAPLVLEPREKREHMSIFSLAERPIT
jgi:hypothetical protein